MCSSSWLVRFQSKIMQAQRSTGNSASALVKFRKAIPAWPPAICAALTSLWISEASAQGQRMCSVPPPQFQLTETNRVGAQELAALLPGKSMVFVRRWATGTFNRLRREFQTDGTLILLCETGPTPEGPWQPCAQVRSGNSGSSARVTGNREIGVWSLVGSHFCIRHANIGASLGCFALHRHSSRYYAIAVNNYISCIEGDVTFDQITSQ